MRVLFYILQLTVLWIFYATALNDTTTDGPMFTTSDGSYCQDQWMRYGQSCYLRVNDTLDFVQANASCPENGHLASISDEKENDFLRNLSGSTETAWIGLFRRVESCYNHSLCDWIWTDGSELRYTKWRTNGAPGVPKCVSFPRSTGIWGNDQYCNTKLEFICERSVWFLTTTPATMMTTEVVPGRSTTMVNANHTVESNADNVEDDDDDMPIIIGCVVGGLVLVTIIAVVAIVLLKRHRRSSRTDQPVEDKVEETPPVAKRVRYNPGYEDVETQGETNVTFKPSPDNTDTGAHGVGDNPHQLYSEPMKKSDRPGSKGILVNENTLYGSGK